METLTMYLLKMLICSGILFGYYRLALYNERFHQWNRFYLLAAMFLSVVVPLINIPIFAEEEPGNMVVIIASMPWNASVTKAPIPTALSWQDILLLGLSIVSITMFLKVVTNVTRLFITYKTNPVNSLDSKVQLVLTKLKHAPFSFFNWLFWRQDIDPASDNGQRMLTHELTHIREHHSIDKIFTEVLLCIFWMNPFFWLIRRELGTVHEFLADRRAIAQQDGAAFAAMILHALQVQPSTTSGLVNPLFSSTIKRRLLMITTSKEPRYSYLRRLSGLVLMICSAIALTLTIQQVQAQQKEKVAEKKTTTAPQKPESRTKVHVTNKPVTKPARVIAIEADSIIWQGTKGEASGGTSSGEKIEMRADNIIIYDNRNPTNLKIEPLYILDGKEIAPKEFKAINPNTIESINISKGEDAVAEYGDKGKYGVVKIVSKNNLRELLEAVDRVNEITNRKTNLSAQEVVETANRGFDDNKVFTRVEHPAQFPGGEELWRKYLAAQLHYPEAALKAGTEGVVRLQFIVNTKGSMSHIKLLNDPGNGIGEEAVRLISTGPKWEPAIQNGKEVNYQVELSIDFKINKYF